MQKNVIYSKLIYVAVLILTLNSCSSNPEGIEPESMPLSFDEINYSLIVKNNPNLKSDPISTTDVTGKLVDTGDIFFYETNGGRMGKFEILYIASVDNFNLYIKAVTYNENGEIFSSSDELKIRGTWSADLDEMMEYGTSNDFFWNRIDETNTELSPIDNARFYHFKQ